MTRVNLDSSGCIINIENAGDVGPSLTFSYYSESVFDENKKNL